MFPVWLVITIVVGSVAVVALLGYLIDKSADQERD